MSMEFRIMPNKPIALIDEEIDYTATIKNISDTISPQVNLMADIAKEFEIKEVEINGKLQGQSKDPREVILSAISAGAESVVKFRTRVAAVPNPNPYYTDAKIEYGKKVQFAKDEGVFIGKVPAIAGAKNSKQSSASVGDIIDYEVIFKNTGSSSFTDVILMDMLPGNVEFIPGSIIIDGISYPDLDLLQGISTGPLVSAQTRKVAFQVNVLSFVPKIVNSAELTYFTKEGQSGTVNTTISKIPMINDTLRFTKNVVPTVNQPLMIGDKVTYIAEMINTGNVSLENVMFKDDIPFGLMLNPDLLDIATTFDGNYIINNPDLENGVNLGKIPVGGRIRILYTVEVAGGTCTGTFINDAYAEYNFRYLDGTIGEGESEHGSVALSVGMTNFNQLCAEAYCRIPCQKPDMEEVNDIGAEAEITKYYVIETYKGTSDEGTVLTGYKLLINGNFNINIQYTADEIEQPINSYKCSIPFGTFIILPVDYKKDMNIKPSIIIENISVDMTDRRGAYIGIIYMAYAKICG